MLFPLDVALHIRFVFYLWGYLFLHESFELRERIMFRQKFALSKDLERLTSENTDCFPMILRCLVVELQAY